MDIHGVKSVQQFIIYGIQPLYLLKTIRMTFRTIFLFLILFNLGRPAGLRAQGFDQTPKNEQSRDWPQWMGPQRDGTWIPGIEIDTLTDASFVRLWQAEVGSGYTGPTVAAGRVYLMDYHRAEMELERILCLDLGSGEMIWEHDYQVEYGVGYPTGPRASVLIHEGKAYAFGTMGDLHCLDAASGQLLWHLDGNERYSIDMPIWGLASSPLIEEDLLIVQMGGKDGACMLGLDKDSGKEIWRALDDEASYCAPVIIRQAGSRVLVAWTGERVAGLDPICGELHWSIPFEQTKSVINIATPEYEAPYLFLSSFYDGSMLIELEQESKGAQMVWKRRGRSERQTDALHSIMSSPFIQGEHVYGVDSYGEFRCLELMSGDRVWTDSTLTPYGRWSNAHFVFDRGRFWAFNELGDLVLGRVSPEGFEDLGRVHLIDPVSISPNPRGGVNWAFPAFAGNRIVVRSDDRLIAYRLIPEK